MSRILLLASVLLSISIRVAHAQPGESSAELQSLFASRAEIHSAPRLVRLPVPLEVLRETRPDLSDLRIFDERGTEVPFFLELPSRDAVPARTLRVHGRPREVRRWRHGSRYTEWFELEVPENDDENYDWELHFSIRHRRFVSQARITVRGQDGERQVVRGSLFRLGSPLREKLSLPLRARRPVRVRVELTSERGYLEPSFTWLASESAPDYSELRTLLRIADSRQDGQTSVLVIERPSGLVPERLEIATTSSSFMRAVRVISEDAARGRVPIAHSSILRLANTDDSRSPSVEELTIPVRPAQGERLEVRIENHDGPPLEDIRVFSVVRQPALIFDGTHAQWLRFGGGRVRAPRYDFEHLIRVDAQRELIQASPAATLGSVEPEPTFLRGPALASILREGADIDLTEFSHLASLAITETGDGLAQATLSADVLAVARPDLADLRIVDDNGAQLSYLTIDATNPLELSLPIAHHSFSDGESRFALTMSAARLAPSAVEIDFPADLVDRPVAVYGRNEEGRELLLGRGQLRRVPPDRDPVLIPLTGARTRSLELRVADGDDAPLELSSVVVSVPTKELLVVAPAGTYRLAVGNAALTPPRYEIQRIRERVLAVRPSVATIGPLHPNASRAEEAPPETPWLSDAMMVWVILIAAVALLGLLTLRLASTNRHSRTPSDAEAAETDDEGFDRGVER